MTLPPIFLTRFPAHTAEPPNYRIRPITKYAIICEHELTGGHDVVNDENSLAVLDGVALDLEEVGTVLLLVTLSLELAGKLALLSDRNETSIEAQSERGTEQETARLETNNDVGKLVELLSDLKLESIDKVVVGLRRSKDGHDILEQDALAGPVGELAQSISQVYFKMGELGGAGGSGGGLASFGAIGVQLGMWCRRGRVGFGAVGVRGGRWAVDVLGAGTLVFRVAVRRVLAEGDGFG